MITITQQMWSWCVSYPYKWGAQTKYFTTEKEAIEFAKTI